LVDKTERGASFNDPIEPDLRTSSHTNAKRQRALESSSNSEKHLYPHSARGAIRRWTFEGIPTRLVWWLADLDSTYEALLSCT
jgi:hypothetical protein